MTKFIKQLIIINGIAIPLTLGIIVFQIFKAESSNSQRDYYDEGFYLGERFEEAKADSMALQGLSYASPLSIYNSTNYYLPISLMTYKEAKDLKEASRRAGNIGWSLQHIMNVIFLDSEYQLIGTLLDRKASIIDIEIPRDYEKVVVKTTKNIAYLIGFEDTNNDGTLDRLDWHDLYITDLAGKNMTQATSDIKIESFEFVNSNSQIMIRYKLRNKIREEHKTVKFGLFEIETLQFTELSDLNGELDKLEYNLIK